MSNAEIELKLLLPGADADAIETHLKQWPTLARRRSTQVWLSNIYYDTPDQSLRRQRHALRMRRISGQADGGSGELADMGGTWVQTFKSAGVSQGGLSQRGEWESQERSSQLNPVPLRATPWAALDPDGHLFETLQPCFETRCRRTLWTLRRYRGASIELALDVGEIVAGGRTQPLLELELELKSGPREALFHLAHALAQGVAVLPCDASKAERGYQLAQGGEGAVRTARAIRLAPGVSPLQAAHQVLGEAFEHFSRNLSALLVLDAVEVVHQARVAWRRWHSAWALFSPWLPDRAAPQGLKPLLDALGHLRDLDVLGAGTLDRWLPVYVDGDAVRQRAAQRLLRRVDAARATQRAQVRSLLAQPDTGMALLAMAHALFEVASLVQAATDHPAAPEGTLDPQSGGESKKKDRKKKKGKREEQLKVTAQSKGKRGKRKLSPWALARIDHLQHRMSRAIRAGCSPQASPAERHRARIRAKRTRYATEMLRDVLPARRARALIREATGVQSRVGEERDLTQAVALLSALRADGQLLAFFRGLVAAQ